MLNHVSKNGVERTKAYGDNSLFENRSKTRFLIQTDPSDRFDPNSRYVLRIYVWMKSCVSIKHRYDDSYSEHTNKQISKKVDL
jgi:hypothetical protein